MSRILANDPDYIPYRPRRGSKQHVTNPTVRTLTEIASVLGTTVGDLLGESRQMPPAERASLREAVRALKQVIG